MLMLPPLDPDAADDTKRTTDKKSTPTAKLKTTNEAALIEEAEKDRGENPWLDRAAKKRRRQTRGDNDDATNGSNLIADQQDNDDDDDDDDEVAPAPPSVAEDDATKSEETKRPTSQLTQAELVKRAFAAPADAEDEFREEKERVKEREDPNRKKKKDADDGRKKDWGSCTGDGVRAPPPPPPPSSRTKKRRRDGAAATHEAVLSPAVADEHRRRRGDDRLPHVIISEKRIKAAANALQIGSVPWPYSTREQYENSLKGAVGPEWNVDPAFREAVRPKVRVAAGRVVRPLSRRAKTASSALPRRGPAKF